ncbi:spike base protein, RCAP_Rcc01079 family [Cupriavidus basilensis]
MPADNYARHSVELHSPSADFFVIAPSDGVDLAQVTRAIRVGTGGDVVVVPARGGGPVTFKNCAAGEVLSIRASRVYASGTTATDLVGLC